MEALLDVRPGLAAVDVGDGTSAYAELGGERLLPVSELTPLADFADLRLGQLGAPVPLTPSDPKPALRDAVASVIEIGSQEQVPWIDARRIVAAMADVHLGWDLAEVNQPREAMRADAPLPVETGRAISTSHPASGPDPTAFRFLNVRPEPALKRRDSLRHGEAF